MAGEEVGTSTHNGNPAWNEADVARAIGAAKNACLKDYRIEISPDGTISIVVGPAIRA